MDLALIAAYAEEEHAVHMSEGNRSLGRYWLGLSSAAMALHEGDTDDFAGELYAVYSGMSDDDGEWQTEARKWLKDTYGKELAAFGVLVTSILDALKGGLDDA